MNLPEQKHGDDGQLLPRVGVCQAQPTAMPSSASQGLDGTEPSISEIFISSLIGVELKIQGQIGTFFFFFKLNLPQGQTWVLENMLPMSICSAQ